MTQSRLHSLFESINSAAFAAPTALILLNLLLILFEDCTLATSDCNNNIHTCSLDYIFYSYVVPGNIS